MKQSKDKSRDGRSGLAKTLPDPARGTLSAGRKLCYAFVLVCFAASILAVVVELGLRLSGYGFPTSFFKQIQLGTEMYKVENDKFGLRFFPPEVARSPAPLIFSAQKPLDTYRIFILGESAALGDPKPSYGVGRYLQVLLRDRYPGASFEVISAGVTAINSHAILPIARECARENGNAWIIYMGNNEMVGPFGAMTVFGSPAPPLGLVRLSLMFQQTRTGQWLIAALRKASGKSKKGESWRGMKMFLENEIPPGDPRREVVYRNFQNNLRDIVRAGQRSGAQILLSTVAVNLKDCAPLASTISPDSLSRSNCQSLCLEALRAEERGSFSQAAALYAEASKLAPQSADVEFRLGTCLLRSTNLIAAREHFQRACDMDALPFRADSRINRAVDLVSRQLLNSSSAFCDAAEIFAASSPFRVPGWESFYEHVHFNFSGNYRLARVWAEQVALLLPASITNRDLGTWASQELCERQLGLTDWNRYAVLEEVEHRLMQPPFVNQLNHSSQMALLQQQMQELRQRMDSTAKAQARAVYVEALQKGPDDHRLHENYGEFLEAIGELSPAAEQWQRVTELIPQHHLAYFQWGRLLAHQGKTKEARVPLTQAVTLRPDLAEGWLELGDLNAQEGDLESALADYERERLLAPQDARVYYRMGKAYIKMKRREEALANLRQAINLRPGYWEARYALGEELAFAGNLAEARAEFEEVIRQHPDYAMAHLNLGVALVQQGHLAEALREFDEARRLDPNNKLALDYGNQIRSRARQTRNP